MEKGHQRIAPIDPEATIGADISKPRLDADLHPGGAVRQFANGRTGISRLIVWAEAARPARLVFEATGACHPARDLALGKAKLPGVKINLGKINPRQARRCAEAPGKRVKTDPVDAARLARFGATLHPEVPPARDPALDQRAAFRAELRAARRALVKHRTAARDRAQTRTLDVLKRQGEPHLRRIDSQLERSRRRARRSWLNTRRCGRASTFC